VLTAASFAPISTITSTLTLTTIKFKWFKWFKEFKSLIKRLHVAKIVISIIPTKKMGVFLAKNGFTEQLWFKVTFGSWLRVHDLV
jgi:hypothetical protein